MYARSTTMMTGTDMEPGVAFLRDEVWPAVQAMEGCMGFSLLLDRESGRMIATSSWRSEEDMWRTEPTVAGFRDRAQELMGAEPPRVEEWEIALMHRDHHTGDGTCVRMGLDGSKTTAPVSSLDSKDMACGECHSPYSLSSVLFTVEVPESLPKKDIPV